MTRVVLGALAATAVVVIGGRVPVTAQDTDDVVLLLTDQTFAVEPGQPWRAVFDVTGSLDGVNPDAATTTTTTTSPVGAAPAPLPMADAELRVVARFPVTTRVELAEVLAGQRSNVIDVLTLPLAPTLTTSGATTTLTADVATTAVGNSTGALSLPRAGLYPITVEVVVDGEVIADHDTFLERLPTQPSDAAPMRIAIVAAAPDPGPIPSAAERVEGRRQLAAIAATAAAVDGPITVALPPVLLTDLETSDPALSATLRSSLTGDEVLAMPADVLDPSSAVAIDEQATFTRELVEGEDVLGLALPDAPAQRSAWLVPDEVSTGAAAMLRGLGFDFLILDPDVYDSLDGNIGGFHDPTLAIEVDLGDGARSPAMVVNPSAELLDPAIVERAGTSPTDAAVDLIATLVTARRELGDDLRRSAVLLPAGGVPDAEVSATLARFVAGLPDFAMAPLSAIPAATDTMIVGDDGPQVVSLPASAGPDLTDRARRIDLTRVAAESSGSMLLDEAQVVEWRQELDTLLSTGLEEAEVDASLARISSEAAAVQDEVVAPQPFTFTLTGRSSPLRLNIRNNGDERLQVVVRPSSPKLTFPSGDQLVELPPNGVTEVVIPVVARSNGTSSLEVSLLTPAFDQVVDGPVVLTARVNALTGLGQVVTGGALLVLVSWWYGHFRRRRRLSRALARADEQPVTSNDDTGQVSPDAAEAAVVRQVDALSADSVSDP